MDILEQIANIRDLIESSEDEILIASLLKNVDRLLLNVDLIKYLKGIKYNDDVWVNSFMEYKEGDKPANLCRVLCDSCNTEFQVRESVEYLPVHLGNDKVCTNDDQLFSSLPISNEKTQYDIVKMLNKLRNFPVLVTVEGRVRSNEYISIKEIVIGNLDNQETGGDPEYYGRQEIILIKC